MKKSEMLQLIVRDLIDSGPDINFQARMVLSRIQSCGMLPPSNNYIDEFGDLVETNEWDENICKTVEGGNK